MSRDDDVRRAASLDESASLRRTLKRVQEPRGELVIGEVGDQLPFPPIRFFTISGVPSHESRASHAHHRLEEFFVCLQGACSITLDDGVSRLDYRLDGPEQGLFKPAMYWVVLHSFTPDALVLVLASDIWRKEDHITDYNEFVALARAARP